MTLYEGRNVPFWIRECMQNKYNGIFMDLKAQSGLKADKRDLISFKGFLQKHFKKYIGQNQQNFTYKHK